MNKSSLVKGYIGIKDFIITKISQNQFLIFLIVLIVLIALSWGMIIWYFPQPGVVSAEGTDLQFHANRFYAIIQAIEYKTYPIYINTDALNYYGYAANLFYPDLMLVPFALIAPVIGFASAYKLIIFTYTLLCGIFSYWSLKRVINDSLITILFSLLYTFALYRLIDFSYRGALGEFISFTFLPIVFWGLYEILYGNYKQKWYVISIGFICLIYTHLLSSLLIFICVCVTLIICYKEIKKEPSRLLFLALAGFVSAIISCSFLLPMYEQLRSNSFYFQTHPLTSTIGSQSVEIRRILWGVFNGLSDNKLRIETIGIVLIIPLFFRFAIKGKHPYLRFADICTFVSFILIFALSDMFPWYIFPFNQLSILQFPFRLLQPASFLLACSGAIYLSIVCRQTNRTLVITSCIIIIICYSIRMTGAVYQGYGIYTIDNTETHNLDQLEIVGAEYLSSRMPSDPSKYTRHRIKYIESRKDRIDTGISTLIKSQYRDKDKFILETEQTSGGDLVLPLLYYKGYKAVADNQELKIKQSKDGLIELYSPKSSKITIWYDGTLTQRISLIISLIALIVFIAYIIYTEKKINEKPIIN